MARLRIQAVWRRAQLSADVASDVKLGRNVRVELSPRTRNLIRVGPHCSIGDRVLFGLDGGEVVLGDWIDIRRDANFAVSGTLTMENRNLLQPGISIHCAEAVTLRPLAGIGERVSLVDCVHYFTAPDAAFFDNVKTGPIVIGYNAWIGAKATIGRGVTVGDHSVVAANSLLLEDVPSGHLATGVPATVARRVRLPWLEDASPEGGEIPP